MTQVSQSQIEEVRGAGLPDGTRGRIEELQLENKLGRTSLLKFLFSISDTC
jgi:hypothetical protein